MQKIIVVSLLATMMGLLGWGWLPQRSLAADCAFLHDKINKEKSFIKRRALYRQAVEVCTGDASLHYKYAYELERSRKYELALEQYQRAVALDPTLAKAYFNMGDIYTSQNKLIEARQAYRKGLEFDPDNSRARKNLEAIGSTSQEGTLP
jgi:tetratricopeptide (TPR) repeat protein